MLCRHAFPTSFFGRCFRSILFSPKIRIPFIMRILREFGHARSHVATLALLLNLACESNLNTEHYLPIGSFLHRMVLDPCTYFWRLVGHVQVSLLAGRKADVEIVLWVRTTGRLLRFFLVDGSMYLYCTPSTAVRSNLSCNLSTLVPGTNLSEVRDHDMHTLLCV